MRLLLLSAAVALLLIVSLVTGSDTPQHAKSGSAHHMVLHDYYDYDAQPAPDKPVLHYLEGLPKPRRREVVDRRGRKQRRSVDKPWRREYVLRRTQKLSRPAASIRPAGPIFPSLAPCPTRFDAAAIATNRRTYIFAGEYVYQIYRDGYGLQQKSAFLITDMFPGGPRTVDAAVTNVRKGVTILIQSRRVYRYRWKRDQGRKRFEPIRDSPKNLNPTIDFQPTLAFQWSTGHLYLVGKSGRFAIYDPHWDKSSNVGNVTDHIENMPRDAVGLMRRDSSSALWLTASGGLEVYDLKRKKVAQVYPLNINNYVACISDKMRRA